MKYTHSIPIALLFVGAAFASTGSETVTDDLHRELHPAEGVVLLLDEVVITADTESLELPEVFVRAGSDTLEDSMVEIHLDEVEISSESL